VVLKSVHFAVAVALVLAWGGIARADEYKPSEYLGLDLSKAVLSPKRLGPETQFAPLALEARGGNEAQARAEPFGVPKKVAAERVHVSEPDLALPLRRHLQLAALRSVPSRHPYVAKP
jgi:hypothetical protein